MVFSEQAATNSPSAPLNSALLTDFERLEHTINRLRSLTQLEVQAQWRFCMADMPQSTALNPSQWADWAAAELNAKHHIPWPQGGQVLWLWQRLVVPETLQGYPLHGLTLRLALTWWATQAQVFVNGQLVQEGDLFDTSARICLSQRVQPGEAIAITLRLVSPDHDPGALVRSLCLYERPDHGLYPSPEPGFVADELAVLGHYLTGFAPQNLAAVATTAEQLDWSAIADQSTFDQSLSRLRRDLLPLSDGLKQRQISLLGHAHLDLAWLWPIAETWEVAERTFTSVLQLQADFPELLFCHSSPALYAWMEQNRPALFEQIRAQAAAGRWEVAAGLWVEPEFNLVCGESIVRQVLYGQRYTQQKFGAISKIAWLPDSFGFCWQLPQILALGGIEYFVSQKMRWNDTNAFPHELFEWRSPDGSQLLSLNSAPIGEGIDPLKMIRYACQWEQKTGLPHALWLIGVGDHGGGPSRDMLEVARRWQQSPFFPTLAFSTAQAFLEQVGAQVEAQVGASANLPGVIHSAVAATQNPASLPVPLPLWDTDLYLEFHRGCYTTHADQKWQNRRCEEALHEAELFAAIATLRLGTPYPQSEIETAWKQVLFNQFHDILPGSAIAPVYDDANRAWQQAAIAAGSIRDEALRAIATQIHLPSPPHPAAQPVVVFNPFNWMRSEVVRVPLEPMNSDSEQGGWQICDLAGGAIATQLIKPLPQTTYPEHLLFVAEAIPAVGYRCFWLYPDETARWADPPPPHLDPQLFVLENDHLRVQVDPLTGALASVFDKNQQREVLVGAGNQLQAFQDSGQYWDAWNIDPHYAAHPLPAAKLVEIRHGHWGAVETSIEVIRKIGQSLFTQQYVLQQNSPLLQIRTVVDWQERHVLVKAAFALNLAAEVATYEIPYGAIQRSTSREGDRDSAQWEVPALHWADLTSTSEPPSGLPIYGVSLLNNGKYGYDSQPSQLRLTLLRGSEWPNPTADLGQHEFTYALYPHAGSWQSAQTVRRGYELNQPLLTLILSPAPQPSNDSGTADPKNSLTPSGQFLNLAGEHLILTTFKRAEDNSDRWVIRGYECHGEAATLDLETMLLGDLLHPAKAATGLIPPTLELSDLLENPLVPAARMEDSVAIAPWKIFTLRLQLHAKE